MNYTIYWNWQIVIRIYAAKATEEKEREQQRIIITTNDSLIEHPSQASQG
jgi:hypothetical protein